MKNSTILAFPVILVSSSALALFFAALPFVPNSPEPITFYTRLYVKLERSCKAYLEEFQKTLQVLQGHELLSQSLSCLNQLSYPTETQEYQNLATTKDQLLLLKDKDFMPPIFHSTVKAIVSDLNLNNKEVAKSPLTYSERFINPFTVFNFIIIFFTMSLFYSSLYL